MTLGRYRRSILSRLQSWFPAIEFHSGIMSFCWIPTYEIFSDIRKPVWKWVWAACSGSAADCNGKIVNDLADITTRGSSPAPILHIHSLHHIAASTGTSSYAITGQRAKLTIISSTFSQSLAFFASSNYFELGIFPGPCSNLVDSKLRLLLSEGWLTNVLLTINWDKFFIACVRQHSHTATQWQTPEQREPQTHLDCTTFPWSKLVNQKRSLQIRKFCISNMQRVFSAYHYFVIKIPISPWKKDLWIK